MLRRDEVVRGQGRLRHSSPLLLEGNPQIPHCVLGQGMPRRDEVVRRKGRLRHSSPLPREGNPQIRHRVLGQGMPRRDEVVRGKGRLCHSSPLPREGNPQIRHCVLGQGMPGRGKDFLNKNILPLPRSEKEPRRGRFFMRGGWRRFGRRSRRYGGWRIWG